MAPTVLIVDDDVGMRELLRFKLADEFEMLDRLRSEVAPDLPVVLLTAAETEERVDDTIDVADRIEKPFRVAEIVDCVRRVLGEPAAD